MNDRWRRQPHAAHEFIRLFVEAAFKHRKRGNRHIPPLGIVKSRRLAQCGRAIVLGPPYRRLRWMGLVCMLAAILSGCGLQGVGALLPVLEGGLGGLGGSSTTLTLHIDQAHGDLTMGNPPAMTPVGTPINPGSPITLQPAPPPPTALPPSSPAPPPPLPSGGPIVTPPPPVVVGQPLPPRPPGSPPPVVGNPG